MHFYGKGHPTMNKRKGLSSQGIPAVVDHRAGVSDYLRFAVRQSRAVSGVHCVQTAGAAIRAEPAQRTAYRKTLNFPARWSRATAPSLSAMPASRGYAKPNERVFVDISGK